MHAMATLQGGVKSPTAAGAQENPITDCLQSLTMALPGTTCFPPSQNTEVCRVAQRPEVGSWRGAQFLRQPQCQCGVGAVGLTGAVGTELDKGSRGFGAGPWGWPAS